MSFSGAIEVYQDVSFVYPLSSSALLRRNLEDSVIAPWRMDPEWEIEIRSGLNNDVEIISFFRESFCGVCPCYLSLWGNAPVDWDIPNIASKSAGDRLSIHQYNEILNEFVRLILEPSLNALGEEGSALSITPRRMNLLEMMSSKTLSGLHALISFNVSDELSRHTNYEGLLCDFILSLHKDENLSQKSKRQFDTELFSRWLTEAEAWSEEDATALAVRIDQGLTLLDRGSLQASGKKLP